MDASTNSRTGRRGYPKGSIGMVSPSRHSPMSPLAKRVESAPVNGKPGRAALVPRNVREKAWATMRRGGQLNLLANVPSIVSTSPPDINESKVPSASLPSPQSSNPPSDQQKPTTDITPAATESPTSPVTMLVSPGNGATRKKALSISPPRRVTPVESRALPAPPPRSPVSETVTPVSPKHSNGATSPRYSPRASSALPVDENGLPRTSPNRDLHTIDACGMSPILSRESADSSEENGGSSGAQRAVETTMEQVFPNANSSSNESQGDAATSFLDAIAQPPTRTRNTHASATPASPDVSVRLTAPALRDLFAQVNTTGGLVTERLLQTFLQQIPVEGESLRTRMAHHFMELYGNGAHGMSIADFINLLDDGSFVEWLAMALEGVATDADTESLRSHDSTGVPPMAELSPTRQYNVLPVSHADPSSPGVAADVAGYSGKSTPTTACSSPASPRTHTPPLTEFLHSGALHGGMYSRSVSPLRPLSAYSTSPGDMVKRRALKGIFNELDSARTGMVNLADFGVFIAKKKLSKKRVSSTFVRRGSNEGGCGPRGMLRHSTSATSVTSTGGIRTSMTLDRFYEVFHGMVDDEGNVDDMIEFVHELSAAWMTKVHDLTEIVLAKERAITDLRETAKRTNMHLKDTHNTTWEDVDSINLEMSITQEQLNRSHRQNSLKQSKVKTLKQENEQLTQDIRLLEERRDELEASLTQSNHERQRLAELKQSLEALVNDSEEECVNLSYENNALADRLRQVEAENAALVQERPVLHADVNDLRAEVAQLLHEKNVAMERLAIFQKDYDDEQFNRRMRRNASSKALDADDSVASDDNFGSTLASEVPELDNVETLQETVNRHVTELSELRCTVKELEDKLLAATAAVTSAQETSANLHAALADEHSRISALLAECSELQKNADSARKKADHLRENADIQQKSATLQLHTAQQQTLSAERHVAALKTAVAEQRDTIARLTEERADAEAHTATEAQRMLHKLKQRAAEFRAVNDMLRCDVAWLVDENIKLSESTQLAKTQKHTAMRHRVAANAATAGKHTLKHPLTECTNRC